ncbi:54S ribosomal protein L3 [Dermatophagoides pteronyssinus]|uniref:Large ribosomal subunit protein uL3m n=1 Tax=Dermatophagoides pteronyssinus TaxID=6956 RepID=A0ABQ8JNQ0_DERPT|nr:54S ribosomal protein L3 [Dermatophagoides pteronyssinus]
MFRSLIQTCSQNFGRTFINQSSIDINLNNSRIVNSVLTISVRNGRYSAPTTKRRKTYPYHWLGRAEKNSTLKNYLTKENKKFLDDIDHSKQEPFQNNKSPLKIEQLEKCEYEEGSMRCGVIAKKIGVQPMWTKDGQRLLTSVLQIVDNHVVSYIKNEDFVRTRRPFYKNHRFKNMDVLVVGAENASHLNYPLSYLGLFQKANLPPKKKLTRFFITPNAKLTPGTPLSANHFCVGHYVDVWGKTIDHGFQGVMKRWNFKGQLKHHGVTKAHRRPGTIARGRKLMGPVKGTKMAGHMGSERRTLKGLKIWRINTKYNVIWVHGPAVPGATNSWVYIHDTSLQEKKYNKDNHPPFPTYYEEESEEKLPENIYDKDLHPFDEPSLLFEETEEERKAALAALRMTKKAKIAKIR